MYKRILVPIDGSATSRAGLREAVRLAKAANGQLRLLHVVDDLPFVLSGDAYPGAMGDILDMIFKEAKQLLEQSRDEVIAENVAADVVLCQRLKGRICEHVAEQATAWNADLIVLGTHGRRGAGRFLLGSDAEQVLRTAPVPVLLIRGAVSAADANAPLGAVEGGLAITSITSERDRVIGA